MDLVDLALKFPGPSLSSAAIVLLVLAITLVGFAEATLRGAVSPARVNLAPGKAADNWRPVRLGDVRLPRPTIPYAAISADAGVGGSAILQSTAANVLAAPIPGSPVDPGPPIPARYTGRAIGDTHIGVFTFIP
jgi:ABC-type enterobactin transport system permease subunit